jgi:hypothetical protein
LQQALQLLQTQRQPAQGESLIQSTQVLQRMLEPINRQLQVLMRQPAPAINIAQPAINVTQPPISITQPPISITQPPINFPPINITQPPINFPPINITQPPISVSQTMPQAMLKPQASMASQTEVVAPRPAPPVEAERDTAFSRLEGIKPFPPYQLPQTPLSYRDYVLDLPDAQLVQPAKPLVPGGSLRLDPEHEDVPIVEAEAKEAEKPLPPMSIDYEELISTIRESEGAEGNKKRLPGQYTKKELIDMVTSVTGQRFAPSLKNPYYRIKTQAIDFIRSIM